MSTYNFVPPPNGAFTFQPTLDGVVYTATIVWNLFGQRWYLVLTTLSGTPVVTIPVIGSPPNFTINMLGGYFQTSVMTFNSASSQFVVTP